MKIADLQESPGKTQGKEMLVVRVLSCRDGVVGRTAKWECFLIDGPSPVDVLLFDAWGPRINRAKAALKENETYQIENYVIHNKGKSLPFGNNTIKMTFMPQLRIKPFDNSIYFYVLLPKELPTSDLDDLTELRSIQIISLVLEVDKPAPKKDHIIPTTEDYGAALRTMTNHARNPVTNVMMKAKNKLIQFSAWGMYADIMANKTGVLRLDAVRITPICGNAKMKISTEDCSSIKDATLEEAAKLLSQRHDDRNDMTMENLVDHIEDPDDFVQSYGGGQSGQTLQEYLQSDVDNVMNLLSQATQYFYLSRKKVRRYVHMAGAAAFFEVDGVQFVEYHENVGGIFSAETQANILEALADHQSYNDAESLDALRLTLPQALFFDTPHSQMNDANDTPKRRRK